MPDLDAARSGKHTGGRKITQQTGKQIELIRILSCYISNRLRNNLNLKIEEDREYIIISHYYRTERGRNAVKMFGR